MHVLSVKGILLYAESDLQHASFWCKELSHDGSSGILQSYQSVWQYTYAHLINKCRRAAILEYFEEITESKPVGECCDVCTQNVPAKDMQKEITAVLLAIKEVPDKGEKKVCMIHYTLYYKPVHYILYE